MSQELLTKYDSIKLPNHNAYQLISNQLFNANLNSKELGMYVLLNILSTRNCFYDGVKNIPNTTSIAICDSLKWTNSKKRVEEILEKLCDKGLLAIKSKSKFMFDVLVLDQDREILLSNGFFKVYGNTIGNILSKTNGSSALTKIGLYAAFRSSIYEKTLQSHIFTASPESLSDLLGCTESTIRRNFVWFRDNGILAYYKCLCGRGYKYIYSDLHDHELLTKYVKEQLESGRYIRNVTE